jgi:hypothetical protein
MVALETFSSETKHFKTGDIDVLNRVFTLRATYKLLDGATGGALCGQAVCASKTIRESANLTVSNTDLTAELIERLADQIADDLLKRNLDVRDVPDGAATNAAAAAGEVRCRSVPGARFAGQRNRALRCRHDGGQPGRPRHQSRVAAGLGAHRGQRGDGGVDARDAHAAAGSTVCG